MMLTRGEKCLATTLVSGCGRDINEELGKEENGEAHKIKRKIMIVLLLFYYFF